jgi:hypothetical protein
MSLKHPRQSFVMPSCFPQILSAWPISQAKLYNQFFISSGVYQM